ncbi:MAG: retention module-containing protein, partial [Sulfurospirillaceae bacterium]|nr:retention module-containing protein [Sulfurospirillaceae bacterium]
MAVSVGMIKSVSGLVMARNAQGEDRILKVGDVVNADETISTVGAGSSVVVGLADGKEIAIGGNEGVFLDKSVYASESFGQEAIVAEQTVADATTGKTAEEIQQALLRGEDVTNLEETAAGEGGNPSMGAYGAARYLQGGSENILGDTGLLDFGDGAIGGGLFGGNESIDVNDAPVAVSDAVGNGQAFVYENNSVAINVLPNDYDLDGDVLSINSFDTTVSYLRDGVLVTAGNITQVGGQLVFEPGTDFDYLAVGESQVVTFTYDIKDDSGADNSISNRATISITITGTNDRPVVEDININGNGNTTTGTELSEVHAIVPDGEGSVGYTNFTIYETTTVSIRASSLGDAYLRVFRNDGNLSTDDQIASNDDSGGWLNSYLSLTLEPGEYIAAVGNYYMSVEEAVSGINPSYNNTITLTFNANHPIAIHDSNVTVIYETHDSGESSPLDNDGHNIFTGALLVTDLDESDTHTFSVVEDTLQITDDSGAGIDTDDIQVSVYEEEGTWNYRIEGNFTELAAGETSTVTFQYVADDGHGFDGTDGIHESSVSEPKTITVTITGTNDQPVVSDVNVNGNGDGEVVGLDAINQVSYSYGLWDQVQIFTATETHLSQIDVNIQDGDTGSFRVQITDMSGDVVLFTSDTVTVTGVGQNIVSANLNVDLVQGQQYKVSYIDAGSLLGDVTVSGIEGDGDGIWWANSLYDHQDLAIRLVYGSGETVVYETRSNGEDGDVYTTYEGTLSVEDDDANDTHTFYGVVEGEEEGIAYEIDAPE